MAPNNLSQWRDPNLEIRISVMQWLHQETIGDQFIEHPRTIWLLWNYLIKIGLWGVLNKISSRLSERTRNEKIAGIGIGYVLESPPDSPIIVDQPVFFFAPNHSPNANAVVVNKNFVRPLIDYGSKPDVVSKSIRCESLDGLQCR